MFGIPGFQSKALGVLPRSSIKDFWATFPRVHQYADDLGQSLFVFNFMPKRAHTNLAGGERTPF